MKKALAVIGAFSLAAIGALAFSTPAAGSAADTASVSVVHGIPNTPVNVFVDGEPVLPNFEPSTVAGPLELPAGTYEVTVFPAADTTGSGTPVLDAQATVAGGDNVTLVAHLTADGNPTITPYANDTASTAPGQARLVVRHDAAAPAVDVRANGAVAFAGLENPDEATADLAAGTISADVVLAGTQTIAIGPADLTLAEGSSTIVYAIGSAQDGNLDLVVQTIDGLHSSPSGVPAGSGGQSATDGLPTGTALISALGAVIAIAAFAMLRSGRRAPSSR